MGNLNKVMLIGRLTRDPQLRYIPSGTAVTDLGVAVSRYYKGQDGSRQEETCFVDVTVWGKQAENATEYLSKGSQVFIEGYLRLDSWEDKNTGDKRSKLKVVANNVQYLDSRGAAGNKDKAAEPRSGESGETPDAEIPF
jgi:single-strand DNA-binding protein